MRILAVLFLTGIGLFGQAALSPAEQALVQAVEARTDRSVALLEKLVNINSGSFNPAGVRSVAEVMSAELRDLGFTVKLLPMDGIQRGPHLVAERQGTTKGKPILLIGHMDTVFEPASPFQKWERKGRTAVGPGTADMKGGLIVILSALQGLYAAKMLDQIPLTIVLTADEEAPGTISVSRASMIAEAKRARAALSFEGGSRGVDKDYATTARRGFTGWELKSTGKSGHSGQMFSERAGFGAIYEISRVIDEFQKTLREPNMTFNVGLLLGGLDAKATDDGVGSVTGKNNIIAGEAMARGEIRALQPEQVARIKDRMYAIVAKSLPGTSSKITFEEGYPPMAPTEGNRRLLRVLSGASAAAGLGEMGELDPMLRGAGDASFVAPYVDTLDGLGAVGAGSHAMGELVDLDSLPKQAKRAALLIKRLAD